MFCLLYQAATDSSVLFRFIDELILPVEISAKIAKITPEMISTSNVLPVDLRPEHIIVHNLVLNYGSKVGRWNPCQTCVKPTRYQRPWLPGQKSCGRHQVFSRLLRSRVLSHPKAQGFVHFTESGEVDREIPAALHSLIFVNGLLLRFSSKNALYACIREVWIPKSTGLSMCAALAFMRHSSLNVIGSAPPCLVVLCFGVLCRKRSVSL